MAKLTGYYDVSELDLTLHSQHPNYITTAEDAKRTGVAIFMSVPSMIGEAEGYQAKGCFPLSYLEKVSYGAIIHFPNNASFSIRSGSLAVFENGLVRFEGVLHNGTPDGSEYWSPDR